MEPYNPNKNYFGAEGTKMCEILGDILEFAPAVRDGINRSAYNHDGGYDGKKETGFFSWWKNYSERKEIDKDFRYEMQYTIANARLLGYISKHEADCADHLVDLAYTAVRVGGWKFYRTDNES